MSKLRVGVIGLGEVAQVIHLPVIDSAPGPLRAGRDL